MIRTVGQYKALFSAVIQQYQKIINNVMEKFAEYDLLRPIYNAHLQVVDKLDRLLVALTEILENPIASMHDYIIRVRHVADKVAADVLAAIKNEYVQGIAEVVVEKFRYVYTHYELEEKFISALKQVVSSTLSFVKNNAMYMVNDYLGLEKDKLMVYNPRGGELEFELYVPSGLPRLTFPVNLDHVKELYASGKNAVMDFHQSLPKPSDYNLWDIYYQYKPDSNPANWIPPFTGECEL